MYELRILSGLHRGATLPLHDESHTIGASDQADVVLVDESIEEVHATLSKTDAGWLLSARNGQLFGAETNQCQTLIDLAPGVFARVGDVWIVILQQDDPGVTAPPVPVDEQFTATGAEFEAHAEQADALAIEDALEAELPPSPVAATAAGEGEPVVQRKRLGPRIALASMAATVVLSAAAAYAITSQSASSDGAQEADPGAYLTQTDVRNDGLAQRPAAHGNESGSSPGGATATLITPEVLRNAFRKRLADAELLAPFDMKLEDASWQMQANLNQEETKRFDRILQAFKSEHQIDFPVTAKIVSGEAMLPFKVIQVISGANANVVTQDGQRLFVGEEYRGVRLLAIQDNRLIFAGKRKIEMNW